MRTVETIAREICRSYGGDPDEWIRLAPAGPPIRYWQHFEQLAELTLLWLLRFSRPA